MRRANYTHLLPIPMCGIAMGWQVDQAWAMSKLPQNQSTASDIESISRRSLFHPDNEGAYQAWRVAKLKNYPNSIDALRTPIKDASLLTHDEKERLVACCRKTNMVIYQLQGDAGEDRDMIRILAEQLGLRRFDHNLRADEDSVTSLRAVEESEGTLYIPYTNRALSWHTDGYYNRKNEQIRGILMHCVSPAHDGGENSMLDHEIAYMRVRDENPDFIRALMHPRAMTIPANISTGIEIRGAVSGPVFSTLEGGVLHMRYSARQKNVEWRDDENTRQAVGFLLDLLNENTKYTMQHRFAPGEGIICNNVLHNRTSFEDLPEQGRLHYRARYYDRIEGTGKLEGIKEPLIYS